MTENELQVVIERQRQTIDSFLADRAQWGVTQCKNIELKEEVEDLKAALVEARGERDMLRRENIDLRQDRDWLAANEAGK